MTNEYCLSQTVMLRHAFSYHWTFEFTSLWEVFSMIQIYQCWNCYKQSYARLDIFAFVWELKVKHRWNIVEVNSLRRCLNCRDLWRCFFFLVEGGTASEDAGAGQSQQQGSQLDFHGPQQVPFLYVTEGLYFRFFHCPDRNDRLNVCMQNKKIRGRQKRGRWKSIPKYVQMIF